MDWIKMLKHVNKDKIRTDKARSFKEQKGKRYVNLPILLSKA